MAFGRYELIERLAVGGMAELFRARIFGSHGFQKTVAIKKILPHLAMDASFTSMFIDEAKITARLDHPKIAQVLELGTIEDQLYIAMEFVDGPDVLALLRACAQRKQALPVGISVQIAHEILDALEYAHNASDDDGNPLSIVHRDISPSNVLISRRGDVKLADFGIAHAVERQQKTQAGTLKGKYGYMSPEQVVGGQLTGRSDLFSVGIVLAEMLMGRRLFTAPNELDVLLMVRDVRLDRLQKYGAAIPADLSELLHRALAREPNERYQHAGEFRDALADWMFSNRVRVGPSELAVLVNDLVEPNRRPGAGGPATLAGQHTQAKQMAADDLRRAGQAAAAAVGSGTALPSASGTSVPPTQRPPAGAAPPRPPAPRPAAAPIKSPPAAPAPLPIDQQFVTLDLGELLPDQAAVSALLSNEGESGPVVMLERPEPRQAPTAPITSSAQQEAASRSTLEFVPTAEALRRPNQVHVSPEMVAEARKQTIPPPPPRMKIGVGESAQPDARGDLAQRTAVHVLYRLAVDKSDGLLVVEISSITKEIYLTGGNPEYVSSNVARELFGEYLVGQKVIAQGELAMALAMMPHFGGKLGDTLVGLGLMKPLDVFRHLTRQVRDKVIDVCTWGKGSWRWYHGRRNERESFPLGLDAFEVLGAGANALPTKQIDAWFLGNAHKSPHPAKNPRVVPEAFRLGSYPRDVYDRLDGRTALRDLASRFTDDGERLAYLRTLYLLVQTDLAIL
jgi:serine/threonine-protein kinase